MTFYLPAPGDDLPPPESGLYGVARAVAEEGDEGDSPEMVYVWSRAVTRQAARYREAADHRRRILWLDEREGTVHPDVLLDAWADELVELHFLAEAGVQMLRWASLPPERTAAPERCGTCGQVKRQPGDPWDTRRLLYDIPPMKQTEWVKKLRNLLVHYDEKYREKDLRTASVDSRDIDGLVEAARFLKRHLNTPDDLDVEDDR